LLLLVVVVVVERGGVGVIRRQAGEVRGYLLAVVVP